MSSLVGQTSWWFASPNPIVFVVILYKVEKPATLLKVHLVINTQVENIPFQNRLLHCIMYRRSLCTLRYLPTTIFAFLFYDPFFLCIVLFQGDLRTWGLFLSFPVELSTGEGRRIPLWLAGDANVMPFMPACKPLPSLVENMENVILCCAVFLCGKLTRKCADYELQLWLKITVKGTISQVGQVALDLKFVLNSLIIL